MKKLTRLWLAVALAVVLIPAFSLAQSNRNEGFKDVNAGDGPVTKPVNGVCPNGYILDGGKCEKPLITTKNPMAPGESSKDASEGSFISAPINGQCPENHLISENGKECIKLDIKIPIAPKEGFKEPTVGSGGDYKITPVNNACPEDYTVSNDGKECLKPNIIPKIIIAPKEGFKEIDFGTKGNITIKDNNTNKETKIAPKEGFKATVFVESNVENQAPTIKEVSVESNVNSENKTITVGQISASTKESISMKENKVFLKQKEIKIMPDTASESAITKLGNLGFKIELKDIGSEGNAKPAYEASAAQDVKILGLFSAKMTVSANVDAQTGTVSELRRPWWSFLAK